MALAHSRWRYISVNISIINMKRFVLIICSILAMSVFYGTAQTKNQTTSEDTIKSFLIKMYNDKLYEGYDFLQKHCSPELLKKLQDAYPYDSDAPAYATWLFRSGQQDRKPGSANVGTSGARLLPPGPIWKGRSTSATFTTTAVPTGCSRRRD